MNYQDFQEMMGEAWDAFFDVIYEHGLDTEKVDGALQRKDCYNDAFDAVISCVEIEEE